MKSRFISDPQDPFGDGVLNTAEDAANFFPASFITAAAHGGGTPPGSAAPVISPDPFPIVPAETLEAQAAQNGPGGPGSVVAVTSATGTGITFNLVFDAAAMAATPAAAAFRAGIQQAASILSATITDNITVTLNIDYSGTGGGAAAGPDTGLYVNYSTVRADLVNNATKGDPTFNALPTGSIQNQSQVAVWDAQLKLFGLALPSNYSGIDGTATFATDINPSLLVGVALHELTHALGRVPYGPQPDIFDFFRSTSPGTELFSGNIPTSAAYFSVDGGYTKIADYGQNSDPSDFLNSGVQGGRDSFNEFYTGSTLQSLTAVDKEQLDALGFHLASPLTTTIQTDTNSIASTSLVGFFSNYYLENASTGAGPELKFGGTPILAGEFGAWTPIGAVVTTTGYEVAWKVAGADQYIVWNTDSSGNYISNLTATVSGTSATLESLETSFHQDLNGDGVIGFPTPVVIESFGSTSLTQVGINYYLDSISSGTGPELKFGGTAVMAGQFGAWTPIGAEVTATGYEVAWKVAGADQYIVWNTDSSGNYISNLTATVSGTSATLESLETSFHQDLNGDGVIGFPAPVVIESFGSTSLTQVGINYYLDSISSGTGPELKFGGTAVMAEQFGAWTPIGAEVTATGYEVAWKVAGADQYIVWNTDSSGNYLSNLTATVSGTSTILESFETSFHQDINGDGTIGPTVTLIQTDTNSFGSTSLKEVANEYFLYNSSGTGPSLNYGGAPVVAGQFGAWTPIGAAVTATGYEVAWKVAGADQYVVWNTDSSGNYISNLTATVSGTSATLESIETSFHQDLNGDGVIGIPPGTAPAPTILTTQAPAVTVLNNDTFVFRHEGVAEIVANAQRADIMELDGFHDNQTAALLRHAEMAQYQALFQPTNDGHETVDSHDSITLKAHMANLHATAFIIH